MAENDVGESANGINESIGNSTGIEAKRAKLKFKRAESADSAAVFGSGDGTTEYKPRKQRAISPDKQTAFNVEDREPIQGRKKVRGSAPTPPVDDDEEPKRGVRKRVGNKYKTFPTKEDAKNDASFLLSGIEVAAVTAVGPRGEMTQWERGILSGPLQRIIARTPLSAIEKGGIFIDIGFLIMGSSIYFSRVLKDVQLPKFGKQKQRGTQEDSRAPQAAPAYSTVERTVTGDIDGLAQPVPSQIQSIMNGSI